MYYFWTYLLNELPLNSALGGGLKVVGQMQFWSVWIHFTPCHIASCQTRSLGFSSGHFMSDLCTNWHWSKIFAENLRFPSGSDRSCILIYHCPQRWTVTCRHFITPSVFKLGTSFLTRHEECADCGHWQGQTRRLVKDKTVTVYTETKIFSWASDGARYQDKLTDRHL
jgi:hypothetical protein